MDRADHVSGHRRAGPPRRLASIEFWTDAVERAVRAAAGGALTVLAGKELTIVPAADWRLAAGAASASAMVSILVSVVAGGVGDPATAGFAAGLPRRQVPVAAADGAGSGAAGRGKVKRPARAPGASHRTP
ncbi:holin [Nonomuraea sp. NPDC049646]|uniref:holin n=1 Tax=unclassified Nonomuraea TaxID=2593643 RepID=UPI0037B0873C